LAECKRLAADYLEQQRSPRLSERLESMNSKNKMEAPPVVEIPDGDTLCCDCYGFDAGAEDSGPRDARLAPYVRNLPRIASMLW